MNTQELLDRVKRTTEYRNYQHTLDMLPGHDDCELVADLWTAVTKTAEYAEYLAAMTAQRVT